MADMNLPPQAYTREILAQAYKWLSDQPDIIKKRAKTADILVSLYTHAQRNGLGSSDHGTWAARNLASAKTFKNDLQSLAQGLRQFEYSNPQQTKTIQDKPDPSPQPLAYVESPQPQISTQPQSTAQPQISTQPQSTAPQNTAPQNSSHCSLPQGLDERSLVTIHKVKHRFNLSSETEALRMLISLGYEKLHALFHQDGP